MNSDREGIFLVSCEREFVFVTGMSEEPPSLKLKPRLAVAPATPSGDSETPPAPVPTTATPAASDSPRLRLKPRLAAEPAATPADAPPPAQAEVAPPPPPPVAALPEATGAEPIIKLRPRTVSPGESSLPLPLPVPAGLPPPPAFTPPESMAPPPPPPPAIPVAEGEAPKFKFKPKGSDNAPPPPPQSMAAMDGSAPPPPPPPPGVTESGVPGRPKTPPPFPVLAPAQGAGTRSPIPIHIRAPESKAGQEALLPLGVPIGAPMRPKKKKKLGLFVGIVALLAVSAGGGFFAYQHFAIEPPPPPKAAAKSKAKQPGGGPTPSTTLNAIAAAPGKMIADAQNAIASRRSGEQGRVDAMSSGNEASGQHALRTPLPGELGGRASAAPAAPALGRVSATTALAPGVTTTTEVRASPEASPAFRSFVADAKVSGVYQGSPPRAFINNRLIKVGQMVEEGLAISFDGIDAENRMLLFKDKTGARVSKQY